MSTLARVVMKKVVAAGKAFLFVVCLLLLIHQSLKMPASNTTDPVLKVDYETWQKVVYRIKNNEKLQDLKATINYKFDIAANLEKHEESPRQRRKQIHISNSKARVAQGQVLAGLIKTQELNSEELYYKLSRNQDLEAVHNIAVSNGWERASFPVEANDTENGFNKNRPILLVWWPPTWKNLPKRKEHYLERNFQGACGNCRLTMDRRLLNRSKVVIFDNLPNVTNLKDLPPTRNPDQAYVLWHRETPAKTFHLRSAMVGVFDTLFNYTMSYKRESDFRWYSGNLEYTLRLWRKQVQGASDIYIDNIIKSKRRLATWIVSNCNNTRGAVERKAYVYKLIEAGLKVDLFGACFGNRITKNNFSAFLAPYKFYLAFENSWHCKDYVTEKFWRNGLMADVVPVVWGPSREDVAAIAPKGSYIHVEDFASPKELVKYLYYLDDNDSEYRKFFTWKKMKIPNGKQPLQTLRPGYEAPLCQMCRRLIKNKGKLPKKVLSSSLRWVFGDMNNTNCFLFDTKHT